MTRAPKLLLSAGLVLGLATAGQAQVTLERKFQENRKTTVETTTKLDQTMTVQGMDIETQSERTMTVAASTGKRGEDGTLPLTVTIEAMKVNISLPGTSITFDSAAPAPAKDENPQFAAMTDVFQAMVGSTYTLKLDTQGKVVGVEGTEKTVDKARDLNPQAAEALESQLNAENVKKEFNEDLGRYPAKPVNPGETWTRTDTINLGMGQTLTFDRTYEYQGTVEKDGKTLDKIGVKTTGVKYAMDNPNLPLTVEKSDMKVESSEGTILFDREAGQAVEETVRAQIKGTLTLGAGGQSVPADLDLTIEQNETTKAK